MGMPKQPPRSRSAEGGQSDDLTGLVVSPKTQHGVAPRTPLLSSKKNDNSLYKNVGAGRYDIPGS